MRLTTARISPLNDEELSDDQREILRPVTARGRILNVFRTLARAPRAAQGFLAWGGYVLSRHNDLPVRERELVILRTGFLCGSGYEWAQHADIALRTGLSSDDIAHVKAGPDDAHWDERDRLLLRAADELHQQQFVQDDTWSGLGRHFEEKQMMDIVFTIGQYTQVAMMLNTFGVQLDEGFASDHLLEIV